MLELGKIIFGVVSLIILYNSVNIELPYFLKSIFKDNQSILQIFSFYYVYDLTQNIPISIISVAIIELSRMYQSELAKIATKYRDNLIQEKDKISNHLRSKKGIENFTSNFFE